MSHRRSVTFDSHANRQTLLKSTVLALRSSISRDRTILVSNALVLLILAIDGSQKEFLNDPSSGQRSADMRVFHLASFAGNRATVETRRLFTAHLTRFEPSFEQNR